MADPITTPKSPSGKDFARAITVAVAHTSTGAAGVETLTLNSQYPAIDRSLQSPILSIVLIESETPANDLSFVFLPSGQMSPGVAPDGAGEFVITGDRTINIYQTADLNGIALISYIPRGTGQKH